MLFAMMLCLRSYAHQLSECHLKPMSHSPRPTNYPACYTCSLPDFTPTTDGSAPACQPAVTDHARHVIQASCDTRHMLLQVAFETAATLSSDSSGAPIPVGMRMHGSEGVTPPLQFDIAQGAGVTLHDRTVQAAGDLSQLTVWLQPDAVGRL